LTSRGAATRNRIVLAAAELMHVQGVAATTIDDVLAASATSKSQFYQHFDDKSELVYEVITDARRRDSVVAAPAAGEGGFLPRALPVARRDGAAVRVAARAVGLRTRFSGRRTVRYRRQSQGITVRALHRMARLLGAALERMREAARSSPTST
jgi:AcrR family transcriptional regulator